MRDSPISERASEATKGSGFFALLRITGTVANQFPIMRVDGEIREAVFLRRLKRFSAVVALKGKEEIAYLPNSGRVWELLTSGQQAFLVKKDNAQRKIGWDLYLFSLGGWVTTASSKLSAVTWTH